MNRREQPLIKEKFIKVDFSLSFVNIVLNTAQKIDVFD